MAEYCCFLGEVSFYSVFYFIRFILCVCAHLFVCVSLVVLFCCCLDSTVIYLWCVIVVYRNFILTYFFVNYAG